MFFEKYPFYAPETDEGSFVENTDEVLEQESEQVDEQDDEVQEEGKVPLAVLLKEKAKRKELEKRVKELELQDEQKEVDTQITKIQARLVNQGYSEEEAREEAEEVYYTRQMARQSKKESEEKSFRLQLKELATTDNFYKDCELYADEIKAKIKKIPDIDVEEAYMLVRGGLGRKEFKEDLEQRQAIARRNVATRSGFASNGGSMNSKYQLDDNDKKALAQLQKVQPESGWNAEKYYKFVKQR